MTLQQLKYLVALDNYRHFVTAAEKCFVNQSTITIQVKKLEEEINIKIFDRSKSPLTVTPAGERIIAKARSVLGEVTEMKELVSDEKESVQGTFKIGIIPTISPYIIPSFSHDFEKEQHDTQLIIEEMESEQIIDSLKKGKLDIGILVTPLDDRDIREVKLYNEPFVFYGSKSHKLIQKEAIELKDLVNIENLWLLKNGHCFKNQVESLCKNYNNKSSIQFQSGSIETLKKMVDKYKGCTIIPEMSVSENDGENIAYFKEPKPIREVSLIVHKNFTKEALLEIIRKNILAVIPERFEKNERYIRVKWR
ncbi:MAG: LysR family transcriptional regulator [Crocinitomix sp.]|nr:LysR family transcriptional regulator [Crocinitomix sp.]